MEPQKLARDRLTLAALADGISFSIRAARDDAPWGAHVYAGSIT
jgi:hypothetical protein